MSEYKLVPVEPTEEMLNAGAINIRVSLKRITDANNIYKAMLSASPTTDTITIDSAEYEAMKADAERYRWLRRGQTQEARVVFGKYPDGINIHDANNHLINSALDQAIDQARKI